MASLDTFGFVIKCHVIELDVANTDIVGAISQGFPGMVLFVWLRSYDGLVVFA